MSVTLESKQLDDPMIGDPWFGAGLGAGVGAIGGGLVGAAGGALVGAGEGALGGGISGAALGAMLGPAGAVAGGVIGAGLGAIGGGLMGSVAGGVGGSVLGAGALGLAGSQFINEGDFRGFPDELEGTPLGPTGIEVCDRGAFGASQELGDATGFEHWWLELAGIGAGLGPKTTT
jgi:hypothetical protein